MRLTVRILGLDLLDVELTTDAAEESLHAADYGGESAALRVPHDPTPPLEEPRPFYDDPPDDRKRTGF